MNIIHTGNKNSDISISETTTINETNPEFFTRVRTSSDSVDATLKINEDPIVMAQTVGTRIKEFIRDSLVEAKRNIATLDEKKLNSLYPLQYPLFHINTSAKKPSLITTSLFLGGSFVLIVLFNKYRYIPKHDIEMNEDIETNDDIENNTDTDTEDTEDNDDQSEIETETNISLDNSDSESETESLITNTNDSDNNEETDEEDKKDDAKTKNNINKYESSKKNLFYFSNWFGY